jgi:hypothetical protein
MFDYNDKVKLIKKTGNSIDNISAMAQPGLIFIQDEKVPVEEGDTIERKLPNGVVEQWVVIEPGYYGSDPDFPAYQCKVKRSSKIIDSKPQQIVYNVNGVNAKVNINSADNSTNNVTVNPSDVFDKLTDLIRENIQDNSELIRLIDEMKQQQGKSGFLSNYQSFIASAANHMTLVAPFIPALTQMIIK